MNGLGAEPDDVPGPAWQETGPGDAGAKAMVELENCRIGVAVHHEEADAPRVMVVLRVGTKHGLIEQRVRRARADGFATVQAPEAVGAVPPTHAEAAGELIRPQRPGLVGLGNEEQLVRITK